MSGDQRNAKWFVIAVHVEVAALLLFMAGAAITAFLVWLIGGPFWAPGRWSQLIVWILIGLTLLSPFTVWCAWEVVRTAGARLGYRWGRESKILRFQPEGTLRDLSIGAMIAIGGLCALLPLSNPQIGLWEFVACIAMSLLGTSLGLCSLLWSWDERRSRKANRGNDSKRR